jgi:hypothetical protein
MLIAPSILVLALVGGPLGFGIFRARSGKANTAITAISFATGSSLLLLAALVSTGYLFPAARGVAVSSALAEKLVIALPAVLYMSVLVWFLRKRTPQSVGNLVILGVVFIGPLWFCAAFVWLMVACNFGDCI